MDVLTGAQTVPEATRSLVEAALQYAADSMRSDPGSVVTAAGAMRALTDQVQVLEAAVRTVELRAIERAAKAVSRQRHTVECDEWDEAYNAGIHHAELALWTQRDRLRDSRPMGSRDGRTNS